MRLVKTDPVHVNQWGTYVTTPLINNDSAKIAIRITSYNVCYTKLLRFIVQSFRDGQSRKAVFEKGKLVDDSGIFEDKSSDRGTYVYFVPDNTLFMDYVYKDDFIETMLRNYAYLNTGLAINFNGKKILSKNGLLDLLNENMTSDPLYPIIHLKDEDIEIAFTHSDQYGEEYYSFVNGQHTTQGGTHQSAFREAVGRTIKEFYNKNQELTA